MIKTLFDDNDELVDCDFDKLQLMYEENNGYNTIISHYSFNEDIDYLIKINNTNYNIKYKYRKYTKKSIIKMTYFRNNT